jgi:hypothetical protein
VGAKSKRKGNAGELELSKMLSTMLGGSFIRVPNSGAFIGGKNFHRKAMLSEAQTRHRKGDIVPPDHLPRMVIEAKSYGEFPYHLLIRPKPLPQLDEWIEQTLDCADPGDAVFVAFKITRLGWTVAVSEADASIYAFHNHVRYEGAHGAWRLTDLVDFFERNREVVLVRAGPPATT